jgi:hypothetical protein
MNGFTAWRQTVDARFLRPKTFARVAASAVSRNPPLGCGARQRTIEYIKQTQVDLRRLRVMHPTGNIDAYQNLLIGAYHPERHAKQIEEVKSSPHYPK